MELIQNLLKEHGGELVSTLVGESGFGQAQAEKLVPAVGSQLGDALGGGGLDLGALLGGGDLGSLISKFDLGALAGAAGTDEATAQSGLQAILPKLMSLLGDGAGGAAGLASMLGDKGGLLGAAGKLAGSFFKS